MGNVTAATDALGKGTAYAYDHLHRLTRTTDPLGHATTILLDALGRSVGVTDALGQTRQTSYDALGRPSFQVDALGGTTRSRYDAAGQLLSLTDPVGNETQWAYDNLGREIAMTDPAGATATMAYDAAGRLSSQTDRLGRRKDFSYDADGRLTGETWLAVGGGTVNLITYTYDNGDRLLSAQDNAGTVGFGYDDLGRVTSASGVWGTSLAFSYDAGNRRTLTTDSLGGVLTSVYDNAGRLTSRRFGGSGQTPLRLDLDYSLRNEVTTVTRYSDLAGSTVVGTSIYAHDDAGRLTSIDHKNGAGTVLASYVYAYDNADRLANETINGTPHTYSYDRTSQLTGEDATNYSYDANGNRTMAGYQTGTANRLSNDGTYTYTYDAAGNLIKRSKGPSDETWTYAYDHNNHLISVEKRQTDGGTLLVKATYTYDALAQRVQEQTWQSGVGTTTTRFSYDADGNVWADLDGSNALVTRYLWLDGLEARVAADGTPAWLLTDRLGTIRGVVNGSGTLIGTVIYDAFGQILTETSEAITGRFAHAGLPFGRVVQIVEARERSRLVYLNVWMQEDPILFGDGPNPMLFVHNSPTNYLDPSGLDDFWLFNHPWTVFGEAWSLVFPERSPEYLASPIRPNYNPDQMDRPGLRKGDEIDLDTRDYTERSIQGFKSTLGETGIGVMAVMTPAMLNMRASKFIGEYCQGHINRQFPGQYLNSTVAEIKAAATGRNPDKAAQTAWKLLSELRFRK